MKMLVTGGAGFIGSHLVDRLLLENHEVIVIDNLNTGKRNNLPLGHVNLNFRHMDILDSNLGYWFKGVDYVFHLAALTRPQWSIAHPFESNEVNVQGTLKVFNHAKDAKVKRVVFTSSSSLYGTPEKLPTPEWEYPRPLSPYGAQKYMGEIYAQLFQRMYGLEINCIRPFNVYGTRQGDSGYAAAVPAFIKALKTGKKPFITGDGEQSRDFTYVDDLVDILMRAAFNEKVSGESFNAGGGKSITINDIYSKIAKIMKSDVKADHTDALLEPRITLADTTKAKLLLGWEPRTSIDEGLRLTVEGWK